MARPKGSKNVETVLEVSKPRCPDCQSTEAIVLNTTVQEYAGESDGKPFTHIVRRRMQCECGRVRIDRSLEFRTIQEQPDPSRDAPAG